jgi:hypothetical protein
MAVTPFRNRVEPGVSPWGWLPIPTLISVRRYLPVVVVEPVPGDALLSYIEGRQESERTMAIDSVSSIGPVAALDALMRVDRTQASGAVKNDTQLNASAMSAESRVYAPGNVDTGNARADPTPVSPVAIDVEGSLREASAQVSRASQPDSPMHVDMSVAAQSYTTESAAQDQVVVQQQNDGTPAVNVLA